MHDSSTQPRLQIGDWWADRALNELGHGTEKVRIEPKAMDVLMALAQRSGQVVSREELLAEVWRGAVVTDEVLTQCIIKLRKALGDDPRSPKYIQTIAKRGYRLVASVRHGEVTVDESPALPDKRAVPPVRNMPYLELAAGLAGVLVLALAYFIYGSPRHTAATDAYATAVDIGESRKSGALTVTVLPFEALGPGGGHTYLAHGISNDLMTELSRLSGLRVIAASSLTSAKPLAESARYVVSGTVQRESDALRIHVRLLDAATSEQLWSERFERPFRDLFALQDELVHKLTEQLPGKLTHAERQRLAKRYTRSLEAYDHFLRGRALSLVRRVEENDEARAHYLKALELDPKFARAYANLAMTYAMDSRLQWSAGSPALEKAIQFAETARLIDPDIPEIHWALGFVHVQSRRHDEALKSLQKAIALDRSFADAYALMGGIYTYIGQPEKSIPLLRAALRLNPDGGHLYYLLLGRAYLFQNQPEQALINLREALARNPVNLETRLYYTAAMVANGDLSGAEWEALEIRALDDKIRMHDWLETYPMTDIGQKQKLVDLLAKAGL